MSRRSADQKRLEQHHARHGEGRVNNDRFEGVGDHVAKDDPHLRESKRFGGFDKFHPAKRKDLSPNDLRHGEPLHRADRGEKENEAPTEKHHPRDDVTLPR